MDDLRVQQLFEQVTSTVHDVLLELKENFMGKEVTLVNTYPKVSRGRAAIIDGIIIHSTTGQPLFCCMVLRSGAKGERDFLNSAGWTRSYRPWGEFIVTGED